jgi:hypothetical protein
MYNIRNFSTLIPLKGVGTICFSSYYDKDSVIMYMIGRLHGVYTWELNGRSRLQMQPGPWVNVPSEARL